MNADLKLANGVSSDLMTKDQVAALVASGKVHESFTHSVMGTFDVTLMRERAFSLPMPIQSIALEPDTYTFIAMNRDIDSQRVANLTHQSWYCDPAILIHCKDDTMLIIDGNHRIMRRFEEGMNHFLAFVFEEDEAIRPPADFHLDPKMQWGSMEVSSDGRISPRGNS